MTIYFQFNKAPIVTVQQQLHHHMRPICLTPEIRTALPEQSEFLHASKKQYVHIYNITCLVSVLLWQALLQAWTHQARHCPRSWNLTTSTKTTARAPTNYFRDATWRGWNVPRKSHMANHEQLKPSFRCHVPARESKAGARHPSDSSRKMHIWKQGREEGACWAPCY